MTRKTIPVILIVIITATVRVIVLVIAFDKERFHNAVEIDILGIFDVYSSLQIWLLQKNFSGAKLFRANDVISIEHALCS